MEEALVNYFEIGSCLDDITRQQLVTLTKGSYTITEKGRKVAQELAYDLPRSVRGARCGRCAALPDMGPQGSQVQCQALPKKRTATAPSLHGERAGQ